MMMLHNPLAQTLVLLAAFVFCHTKAVGQVATQLSVEMGLEDSDSSLSASKIGESPFDAGCFLYPGNGHHPDKIVVVRKYANGRRSQRAISVFGTANLIDCIVSGNCVAVLAVVRTGEFGVQQHIRLMTLTGDRKLERSVNVDGWNVDGRLIVSKSEGISAVVATDTGVTRIAMESEPISTIANPQKNAQVFCARSKSGCGVFTCDRDGRVCWLDAKTVQSLEIDPGDPFRVLGVISLAGKEERLLAETGGGTLLTIGPNADNSALTISRFRLQNPAERGVFLGGVVMSKQRLLVAYSPRGVTGSEDNDVGFASLHRIEESGDLAGLTDAGMFHRISFLGAGKFGHVGKTLVFSSNARQTILRD